MKTKLLIIITSVLCCSCVKETSEEKAKLETLPYYQDATFTPNWINPQSDSLKDYHSIPDYKLVNQLGDTVTEKSLQGKIYVTDFFFTTCPGICPKMTTNMQLIQEAFQDDNDVMLVSHSVTPEYDSPDILRNYAEAKGIDANKWLLLTGDRETIYGLGRRFYFVEEDQGLERTDEEFLHTENFVLIDKNKHIRGIYNGLNKVSVSQLIDDIKTLKMEYASL